MHNGIIDIATQAGEIAGELKKLDKRMLELCERLHAEHPEALRGTTDYHPRLYGRDQHPAASAENLSAYLLYDEAGYVEWLKER
jgi:hypothetical protein